MVINHLDNFSNFAGNEDGDFPLKRQQTKDSDFNQFLNSVDVLDLFHSKDSGILRYHLIKC